MRWVILSLLLGSCGHTPIPKTTAASNKLCCERINTATLTLKRFERYCIAAAFLESRYVDPRVQANVKEALEICKYVFGIK